MDASNAFRLIAPKGILPDPVVSLTQAEIVLGRDPALDIPVLSPIVSRRHLRLVRQDGGYAVEDLGSSNGTFLNGERITSVTPLHSGDQIRLGQTICFIYEASPAATAVSCRTVMESLPGVGDVTVPGQSFAPLLEVFMAGGEAQRYRLEKDHYSIGRDDDNDIQIASPIVSRHHARLDRTPSGYRLSVFSEVLNPVLLQGQPVKDGYQLKRGDVLQIGSQGSGSLVRLAYQVAEKTAEQAVREIDFSAKDQLQIGRDPSNDIVLDAPTISRFHARIEKVGQRFRLRDLRSSNGVFVNNQRLVEEAWLKPNDQIRIGPYRFVIHEAHLAQYNETHGMRVEALHLNKWVRKDLNILKDISLFIQPREFVVVVGQSGGGKSTLVDAISGYRRATHGRALVNGVDIYRHFEAIRSEIGFVPQKDIIHMELTVSQALEYAAQLRMPPDTTPEERRERIMKVMEDLDLLHRKDLQVSSLSGGQQKRVSIGVELLTRPGLFFLDEPTSGLDPATETALMQLLRRLADQGHTIILVTHATKNVALADKVIFLARGGYLAWFGPPNEAIAYFDQYRSERERLSGPMEFDEIYRILEDPKSTGADWASRYRETTAYYQYIVHPFGEEAAAAGHIEPGAASSSRAARSELPGQAATYKTGPVPHQRKISSLRQLAVLLARNLRVLARNRFSMALLILAPILISALDLLVARLNDHPPFDQNNGDTASAVLSLFLPAIYCLLVGALTQMREIVKEVDIFRRERLVCLRIFPYVLSKVLTALLFAFYQAGVYTLMHAIAFGNPGGAQALLPVYLTLLLGSLAGMMLGLLASAIAPNPAAAPSVLLLLLVPNIILSGGLSGFTVPPALSAPIGTHWVYKNLIAISGLTADVAADVCWNLPADVTRIMTLEQKKSYGCRCMGTAVFQPGSCRFPGLGKFYTAAIDAPQPAAPPPLGAPPPRPVIPPKPQEPANQADTIAMAQYLQNLKAWDAEATRLQDAYEEAVKAYEKQTEAYQARVRAYQQELATWQADRESAVRPAESTIEQFKKRYAWAFVNKNDPGVYQAALVEGWMASLGLITGMFILILIILRFKDGAR